MICASHGGLNVAKIHTLEVSSAVDLNASIYAACDKPPVLFVTTDDMANALEIPLDQIEISMTCDDAGLCSAAKARLLESLRKLVARVEAGQDIALI